MPRLGKAVLQETLAEHRTRGREQLHRGRHPSQDPEVGLVAPVDSIPEVLLASTIVGVPEDTEDLVALHRRHRKD